MKRLFCLLCCKVDNDVLEFCGVCCYIVEWLELVECVGNLVVLCGVCWGLFVVLVVLVIVCNVRFC